MTSTDTLTPAAARVSDFTELSRRIARAGLLERRHRYYAARGALVSGLFAAGWVAFALLGQSWWQLGVAAFLAVMSGQIALLSHDIAHRQVFRTRRPSEITGLLAGNLGIGMSYGWWMSKHTRHHANPNHQDLDPDVAPDILVWSTSQAARSTGLPRLIGGRQAWWFFPLLTLEGLNLHYSSIKAVLDPTMKQRRWEAGLLLTHFAAYLTALLLVLSPLQALAFMAVHKGLWGLYLGSIFAPNHKGMPLLEAGQRLDFLRKQVLTSRNVRGGPIVDVALGGLNYQIEHHLFPNMPSPGLRAAQPIVRAYCAEIGVPYHETGLLASWREALRHLHEAGAPIRQRPV